MLLLVLIATIFITFTFLLHCTHHFECKYESCNPTTPHHISSDISNQKICCFRMQAINDQQFDFFPISFLIYVVFMLFLCTLIILSEILIYTNEHTNESIYDLLFTYTFQSYHITKHPLFQLHNINIYNKSITIIILNLFLICSVLILATWESLFSWYRYYTTMIITKSFRKIPNKFVIKQFLYYAIPFTLIFIANITLSFYIFICTISLHLTFNIYCSLKFAACLIQKVQFLMTMDHDQKEILQSVYFMKRISIICSIVHSIYLSIFLIAYNPIITHYLPILWSISTFLFSLNFIRNRKVIIKALHSCTGNRFKNNINTSDNNTSMCSLPPPPHNTPQVSINTPNNRSKSKNLLSHITQHILNNPRDAPFQRARSQSAENVAKPKLLNAPPVFTAPKSDPIEIRNRSRIHQPVAPKALLVDEHSPLHTAVNDEIYMPGGIVPNLKLNDHRTSSSRSGLSELAMIELPPMIQPQMETVVDETLFKIDGKRKVTFSDDVKKEKVEWEIDGGVFMDMDVINEEKQCHDLTKQRSKSVGIVLPNMNQNMNKSIEAFNLLEKYGFVSSKNIKLTSISAQVFDQLSPVQMKNIDKLNFANLNSISEIQKKK
eukprot:469575_1